MEKFIYKLNKNWDFFTKVRALYIFTGFYYYYNPLYIYGNIEQKKQIYEENNNPQSLKGNYIICNGWANKYKELLDILGVKSEIKGDFHLYILIYIDDFIIRADMTMIPYMDFMNIKLGFETLHYTLISGDNEIFNQKLFNADKEIGYIKKYYNNELIKQKLNILKEKLKNKSLLCKYTELFDLFNELLESGFIEKLNLIKYLQDNFFDEKEISCIHDKVSYKDNIFTNNVQIDGNDFTFSDSIKTLK